MRVAQRLVLRDDPTVYPETDHMGESLLHREIADLFRALVVLLFAARKTRARVGANQFIYYRPHEPTTSVAPDVYVLPKVAPTETFSSWKTWERGVVPSFALEIVSTDWEKDYRDAPPRYDELGTDELVLFDPSSNGHEERVRWQVWRRTAKGFVLAERTDLDRIRSRVLRAWLRTVGTGDLLRIRIGLGLRGDELVPSSDERAETEAHRAETEARRAETEAHRAETEAQRAETEAQRAHAEAHRAEAEAQRAHAKAHRAEVAEERAVRAERELARLRLEVAKRRAPARRPKRSS